MSYQPEVGSLADRVCAFFRANREEEMSNADIAQKYDVIRSAVSAGLASARSAGWLQFIRSDGGHAVWVAGPNLGDSAPPPVDTAPRTRPRAGARKPGPIVQLPPLDAGALPLRTDVPLPKRTTRVKGHTKYDDVFDRLAEVGHSVVLPLAYRAAINKSAYAYRKRTGHKLRLAAIDAQSFGIWRTA